jgi:hypothetical protein
VRLLRRPHSGSGWLCWPAPVRTVSRVWPQTSTPAAFFRLLARRVACVDGRVGPAHVAEHHGESAEPVPLQVNSFGHSDGHLPRLSDRPGRIWGDGWHGMRQRGHGGRRRLRSLGASSRGTTAVRRFLPARAGLARTRGRGAVKPGRRMSARGILLPDEGILRARGYVPDRPSDCPLQGDQCGAGEGVTPRPARK